MWAWRSLRTLGAVAEPRRFCSATRISRSCRLRARIASNWRASSSGRSRTWGRIFSAKRARTLASIASVLARVPMALAKSRAWRGLITATGILAAARAAARGVSRPPVASRTTKVGPSGLRRATRAAMPASSLGWAKCPALGAGSSHRGEPWRHRCRRRSEACPTVRTPGVRIESPSVPILADAAWVAVRLFELRPVGRRGTKATGRPPRGAKGRTVFHAA